MTGLRSIIAEKLKTIHAADLQLLAAQLAMVRDSGRYRSIYAGGMNAQNQTVAGWPDAAVMAPDGTIDAIEATRDRDDWRGHLRQDVANAISGKYPRLNGLLFVGGYPERQPRYEEIQTARQNAAAEIGIPPERVEILVGPALLDELLLPRAARVVQTILGIPVVPERFRMLDSSGPRLSSRNPFEPVSAEYFAGDVYRSAVADDVEDRLRMFGWALVLGRGASGKTVLAHVVAIGPEYRAGAVWYLDCSDVQETADTVRPAVLRDVTAFGGEGTLFVIDNAHLAVGIADAAFQHWSKYGAPAGTRLLILGREIRRSGDNVLRAGHGVEPVILRAREAELCGVYRRIMRNDLAEEPDVPPDEALSSWLRTFGGDVLDPDHSVDLVAFSAAVARRRANLRRKQWELTEDDAANEVRARYLAPLSSEERTDLLSLASIPDDGRLAAETFSDRYNTLARSIALGIVFESADGPRGQPRYRLLHSALARLLRNAARLDAPARMRACMEVARRSPFTGVLLGREAWDDGEIELGRAMVRAAIESGRWVDGLAHIGAVAHVLKIAASVGVPITLDDEENAAAFIAAVVQRAFESLPQFLRRFLHYLADPRAGLRAMSARIAAELSAPKYRDDWLRLVSRNELHESLTLIRYIAMPHSGLQNVFTDLVEDLAQPAYRPLWFDFSITANRNEVIDFLWYAAPRTDGIGKIYSALIADIRANRNSWAVAVLERPLHGIDRLLIFLTASRNNVRDLGFALIAELRRRPSAWWLDRILSVDVNMLRELFQYMSTADSRLADVRVRLIAQLGRSGTIKTLARHILQSSPELVCGFVAYLATAEAAALELHTALTSELAEPDHAAWWRDAAFAVSLETLSYMLSLMAVPANGLASVRENVVKSLCAPQQAANWRDRVLRANLGHVAVFLRYAGDPANDLTPVVVRLSQEFTSEKTVRALAVSATIAPMEALASFLSVTPHAESITGAIEEGTWNDVRSAERHDDAGNFMGLVKQLNRLGRRDLLAAPAAALIHSAAEGAWPGRKVSLNHLSAVVTYAERKVVDRSFDDIITPSWLEREYMTRTARELARSLLQLLFYLPLEHHPVLSSSSLQRRSETELNRLPDDDDERLSVLALLGATALAGIPMPRNAHRYPAWSGRLIVRRAEANGQFVTEDALRWAALRALARIQPLRPDPAETQIALAGWRCFKARTPFAQAFNDSMVAWLERCRDADWTLVTAPPVRDEVMAALGG